ncbi:hypothetical protein HMPREF3038_00344 [Akkermansia sp. KLE1797]|nr:hypothetical protein HMPREF3038_00344 [Akkermansia sp. KLE1797]KXU55062.1 hypothetical protein HMPREF3039_00787 [Akkermansia sp. KLE1798]KZA04306.1 hypothetical protein HMPREF1326_01974 [Akkermansia sp. KLE1605]
MKEMKNSGVLFLFQTEVNGFHGPQTVKGPENSGFGHFKEIREMFSMVFVLSGDRGCHGEFTAASPRASLL